MENGLLYVLAFSAMAIALFAVILPQPQTYAEISGTPTLKDEYNFIIEYTGTSYYGLAENGSTYFSHSDLTDTLQDCLDTAPVRIMLNFYGNHTITRTINMNLGTQYIYGKSEASTQNRSTNLALASNVNAAMFLINGTTNPDYYTISRLWLYCNKNGNSAGYGIQTTGSPVHVELTYITITDAKQYGFALVGGQILYMDACAAGQCGSGGFYIQSWSYRSIMRSCWGFDNPTNFQFNAVTDMEVYNLKAYDSNAYTGVFLESCRNMKFYGLDAEANHNDGVKFYGSSYISIFGGIIKNNGQQTNNSYTGILFSPKSTTYSTYNSLFGLVIYSDVAKVHSYGVREADSNENYNLVSGCVVYGSGTANVGLQGANSIQDNVR